MNWALWEHLSPETEIKAKRSLLIIAALTIFVASIEITSDEITLLGFSVRIPQAKLISAGRLLSALMLSVFLLRSLPSFFNSVSEIIKRVLKSKQDQETINLQSSWGFEGYPDFDDGPHGEFEALDHHHSTQTKLLEEKLNVASILLQSVSVIIVDYSVPIFVGFIAIVAPNYPSEFSSNLQGHEMEDVPQEQTSRPLPTTPLEQR